MAEVDQWHIVTPKARTNHVTNPVFGGTSGYIAQGAGVAVSRDGTRQLFDRYGLSVTTSAAGEGVAIKAEGATGGGNFITFNDGTFDATDGTEATAETGGLIVDTGKRGKGYYADAALTNLIKNPSFEVDFSGWYELGVADATRTTTGAIYGSYAVEIDATNASAGLSTSTYSVPVSASTAYSMQCHANVTAGSFRFVVIWYNGGGAYIGVSASSAFTNGTNTYTTTSLATAATCDVRILSIESSSLGTFDGVSFIEADYAPPYFDGTFTGASWSGTAHNSTSTKAAAAVEYAAPLIDNSEARVGFWVKPYDIAGATQYLLYDSGALAGIHIDTSGNIIAYAGSGVALESSTTLVAGNWYHVEFAYSATDKELIINGTTEDTASGSFTYSAVTSWLVGSFAGGGEPHALIADLVIYDDYAGTTNDYTASFYATASALTLGTSGYTSQALTGASIDGTWYEYTAELSNTGVPWLYLMQTGASGSTWHVDGVQLEAKDSATDERTTLIYGGLAGDYRWLGEPHNSQSKRGAFESSGGYVQSFNNDMSFLISQNTGAAMVPVDVLTDNTPGIDGSAFNNIEVLERPFELRGRLIHTTDTEDFHTKRQAIMRAVHSFNGGPRQLWYKGAVVDKYINAYYVNGLEGGSTLQVTNEDLALRWLAVDPYFYETGTRAAELETVNSITLTASFAAYIDGSWATLAQPSSVGGNKRVNALLHHNGRVYIGGDFSNWDGDANADNFTWYNTATNDYGSPPATSTGQIYDMALDSNGNVIIAAANGIFAFDGTSFDASIIGSPSPNANNDVLSVSISPANGDIYISGEFTDIDGVTTVGIAYYNGSSWVTLSTSASGIIANTAVFADLEGNVYLGKRYSDGTSDIEGLDGPILLYDGSAWSEYYASFYGSAVDPSIVKGSDGVVYFSVFREFRGNSEQLITTTTSGDIRRVRRDDTNIYVLGEMQSFTEGDETTYAGGGIVYNNSGAALPWPDLLRGTNKGVNDALFLGDDVYIGGDFDTGAVNFPGETTINYAGTAKASLSVTLKRVGGTSCILRQIQNAATGGKVFINDYNMKDGEQISIEFSQAGVSFVSDIDGVIGSAILSPSNVEAFALYPTQNAGTGANNIQWLVSTSGSPTLTSFATWQNTHLGQD
jgi:hypothetical protein